MRVREARPSDLRHLQALEEAADAAYDNPAPATPATGAERDQAPGFLLVADVEGEVVGFAHVTAAAEQEEVAHLEQLSVLPTHTRQGIGSALVRAALEEARWAGHEEMSLCTYRDVPWNAPFYARLGFVVTEHPTAFQRRLRAHEQALGLDDAGPRVVMTRALSRP